MPISIEHKGILPLGNKSARVVVKVAAGVLPYFNPSMQSLNKDDHPCARFHQAKPALEQVHREISTTLSVEAGFIPGLSQRAWQKDAEGDRYYGMYIYSYKVPVVDLDPPILELVADEVVDGVAIFRAKWFAAGEEKFYENKSINEALGLLEWPEFSDSE
ncbi:hypothetical protein QBC46DRAFT_447008 [Diplogelasinospora grovesii]|uniref:Uncharacterized protein n=1 Tax=Diplogelasinospora grovesii TaxID=303347 RepID=A0AAN6S6X6_9PEZI|nr:hypothetical protein QBC46DRAFT_447008 [Diplogelasinospora grovesii]